MAQVASITPGVGTTSKDSQSPANHSYFSYRGVGMEMETSSYEVDAQQQQHEGISRSGNGFGTAGVGVGATTTTNTSGSAFYPPPPHAYMYRQPRGVYNNNTNHNLHSQYPPNHPSLINTNTTTTTNNTRSNNVSEKKDRWLHNNPNNHKGDPKDEEEVAEEDDEDEDDDDFLKYLYDRTVHAPCQRLPVVPCINSLDMERQLDLFTHCRQPLDLLSLFHHHHPHHPSNQQHQDHPQGDSGGGARILIPGAYVVPTFCEYCGAAHTSDCQSATCHRPRLFFAKKKPPFANPRTSDNYWDPITDDALPVPVPEQPNPPNLHSKPSKNTATRTSSHLSIHASDSIATGTTAEERKSASSWVVSGFFGEK